MVPFRSDRRFAKLKAELTEGAARNGEQASGCVFPFLNFKPIAITIRSSGGGFGLPDIGTAKDS